MSAPTTKALKWAAEQIGVTDIAAIAGLHDGGSPWVLEFRRGGETMHAILRVADWERVGVRMINRAAAGLQIAEANEIPTAQLIALDPDGGNAGDPAMLETYLGPTAAPSRGAMRSAAVALARLHAVHMKPTETLPVVRHHTPPDDHPRMRRWARRYQSATSAERGHILADYLLDHPGWQPEDAVDELAKTATSDLLALADDLVSRLPTPDGGSFVHGDVWFGNMLWDSESCRGFIDWKSAGVGNPGVDVGSLRMRAAFAFGSAAAAEVTAAWEEAMTCEYRDVAYWDVVAALHTPYEEETVARDAFLREALSRLR